MKKIAERSGVCSQVQGLENTGARGPTQERFQPCLILEDSLVGVPWGGKRLVDFQDHRLNWSRGGKAEGCRRKGLPERQGRVEAGEAERSGDLGVGCGRCGGETMRSGGPETGAEAEIQRGGRGACSLPGDLPQDRCLRHWPGSLQDSWLDSQPHTLLGLGPRTCPAPLWACFRHLCDSPPGDEAVEPGWGCPVLQEPVGLGLLEPSPGLGLQGLASFPKHLISLLGILWARGSFSGLRRCLKQGEGSRRGS